MSLGLFQAVTRLLPDPVLLCDGTGQVLAANPAASRAIAGLHAGADLFGLAVQDPALLRTHISNWLRSGGLLPGALAIRDDEGRTHRFRCHGARATWWDGPGPAAQVHLTRLDQTDQFVVLSQQVQALNREVAFRSAVEAERERLLNTEKATRARLQRMYRLTAALAAAATLPEVARAVRETAPAALNATGVQLRLHWERLVPALDPQDNLRALAGDIWATDHDGRQPTTEAAQDSQGPQDAQGSGRAALPQPRRALEAEEPVIAPLEAGGVVLGGLVIRPDAGDPIEPEHLTAVVQQIAQAVRRAGLHEHEHRLAERLQRSLLPQLPTVDGLEIADSYAPGVDMVEVGGDWYDVHHLDDDHVGLTIGDVAGHGLPEAAAMARISAALRSIALRCGRYPGTVLRELNEFLGTYHAGLMATACYLVYNRRTRTLRYAKAGHPPPLLISADGRSRFLEEALAPPLGPMPGMRYREAETAVEAGDTLLLYTDGLIERRGENLDVGLRRLTALARHCTGLTVENLCRQFLDHQPGAEFPDDRALLAVRFPAAPPMPPPGVPAATARPTIPTPTPTPTPDSVP
ncbi:SpoIIE family protein phosphatase [Streptomyces sp. 549]|uniref:SpoIIE family protein phosphatase n=1 Tax=Streptomyces sp. 549 TaxID=3049076 RepID=UPI0024C38DF9|nr:SpoIIE family protein phosphatase [Streptomyces sp. 549]MDK1477047.1 SpoIIE family protein phosphatase [Streptomyces sp. 549]